MKRPTALFPLTLAVASLMPAAVPAAPDAIALVGPDARHQLLVTGKDASGRVRDRTREVRYAVAPAGIVAVDATGAGNEVSRHEALQLTGGVILRFTGQRADLPERAIVEQRGNPLPDG